MPDAIEPRRRDRLQPPMILSLALAIGVAMALVAVAQQPANAPDTGSQGTPADQSEKDSPEKLLKAIEQLRKASPPADATSEQQDQFETQRYRDILSAADRLLACELTPKQALEAVRSKLESIELLGQLGDKHAAVDSASFLDEMEKHRYGKVPQVERYALDFRLMAAIRSPDEKQAAEKARQLWPKVQQVLAAGKPVEIDYRLAMLMGMLAEQTDQPKLAAESYQAFAAYFRGAHAEWADQAAEQMEGTARLLTLVGQTMKIDGTLVDGHAFDLSAYRGRVVLVDFWATWCGPCVAELENLKRVYAQYHPRGLEIVSISLDDSRENLTTFLKDRPIPWSVLHDVPQAAAAQGHPLARHYGVTSLPTLILTDRQGRVVSTHARGETLHKLLAEMLGPAE